MPDDFLVTGGQRLALNKLVNETYRAKRLWIISQLIEREVQSSADVTEPEWRTVCAEAYPNRFDDDWTVADSFRRRLAELKQEYEEAVLGQQRLF